MIAVWLCCMLPAVIYTFVAYRNKKISKLELTPVAKVLKPGEESLIEALRSS